MALVLDTPESGPCTREEAFNRRLIPESTDTYRAVPNEELVLMLNDAARQYGLVLTNEQLGLDLKGNRLFGTYEVEGMDFFGGRSRLMLGFCNSYNKSLRIRVAFGGKVFVCSNLAFHAWTDDESGIVGEVGHRHTPNVNDGLWQRLTHALEQVDKFRAAQEHFYSRLADTPVNRQQAHDVIVRAAMSGCIKKTKIVDIAKEWHYHAEEPETMTPDHPWHPEFRDRNAFNLFNAFTEVEKGRLERNPVTSNIGTLSLTEFFHREFICN